MDLWILMKFSRKFNGDYWFLIKTYARLCREPNPLINAEGGLRIAARKEVEVEVKENAEIKSCRKCTPDHRPDEFIISNRLYISAPLRILPIAIRRTKHNYCDDIFGRNEGK